jgi:hypothetical protein
LLASAAWLLLASLPLVAAAGFAAAGFAAAGFAAAGFAAAGSGGVGAAGFAAAGLAAAGLLPPALAASAPLAWPSLSSVAASAPLHRIRTCRFGGRAQILVRAAMGEARRVWTVWGCVKPYRTCRPLQHAEDDEHEDHELESSTPVRQLKLPVAPESYPDRTTWWTPSLH